jgi:peptide/nickel transport system substrate-binding protein
VAKGWTVAPDGRSIVVELRDNVRFYDGTPVTAQLVASLVHQSLPRLMGPAYDDVASIDVASKDTIEFKLRRPSSFLIDALELDVSKPGAPEVGTGPFMPVREAPAELRANPNYYLGSPAIERVVLNTYPSERAAWAELLRDDLDAVYELGVDGLDSLQSATTINVLTVARPYQYLVLLNPQKPVLRSAATRRALNAGIDRAGLVRDALNGHGTPSAGPVSPRHWAAQGSFHALKYDPQWAAETLARATGHTAGSKPETLLTFSCLVAPENERLALVVKHQLEEIGAEMSVEEASVDRLLEALASHRFDAILFDVLSGPSLFRAYRWWHSAGDFYPGVYASAAVDAALDAIRHSTADDEYRTGVANFQQSILEDPPAIFLAWSERARAVSKRFEVPPAEPGVDVIRTLRLWRPAAPAAPRSVN